MNKLLLILLATFSFNVFAAVNLNTATKEELESLNGVGPVKAQAIIDYRKKNGDFKNVDGLDSVPGFGDATMQKLKGDVSVNGKTTMSLPAAKDAKPATKEAKTEAKATAKEEKPAKAEKATPAEKPATDVKETAAEKKARVAEEKKAAKAAKAEAKAKKAADAKAAKEAKAAEKAKKAEEAKAAKAEKAAAAKAEKK